MLVTSQLPIQTTKILYSSFDLFIEKGSATHCMESDFPSTYRR